MIEVLEDDSTSGAPRALIDLPGPQQLVVTAWSAATEMGRQRVRNEDNWKQLGPIFVIADGMGGLHHGAEASATAVQVVATEWLSNEDGAEAAIRRANEQVRRDGAESGQRGCTLTALRIANDRATMVHVGDSRAYRLRGGRAEQLTQDHNLRNELMAAGITPGSSKAFGPLRSLTSYIGQADADLRIDVRSISLRDGDRLVLCTDGVLDRLSQAEFIGRAEVGTAREATRRLTALRGADDATAVVVDIGVHRD